MQLCCVHESRLQIAVNSIVLSQQLAGNLQRSCTGKRGQCLCRPQQARRNCCCHLHDSYGSRGMTADMRSSLIGCIECEGFQGFMAAYLLDCCHKREKSGIDILGSKHSSGHHPVMYMCMCFESSTGPSCPCLPQISISLSGFIPCYQQTRLLSSTVSCMHLSDYKRPCQAEALQLHLHHSTCLSL